MGDRIRSGAHRRRLAAGACTFVLASVAAPAPAQRPGTSPEATKGHIVGYQESRSANILYLEEGGGMVTRVARPTTRDASEEPVPVTAAAKAPVADSKAKPAAAVSRAPRRSAAVAESAGTRP
jgi:hypothetical protein